MNSLLGQLVFSVGRQQYYWDDVILSARRWGDWANLEKELREGIACLKRLDEAEEEFEPEALESAANDFRYQRDLLTAEEAEAWLNRWNLSADSWMEYLQRFILRRKWADQLVEIAARYRVTKKEIHSSRHAEAICSGHLARFARALAARASAYEKAVEAGWVRDEPKSAEATRRIRRLEASYQRFCDHVVDAQGIKNQVDSHRLEWIRVGCRYVLFSQEQMAREAAGKRGTHYLASEAAAALIGTDDLCDLRVPRGTRHHLLLLRAGQGFEARNLSFWRKMKIGGRAVSRGAIATGDVIEIGGLKLTFMDEVR
jgi:hypothetical protein